MTKKKIVLLVLVSVCALLVTALLVGAIAYIVKICFFPLKVTDINEYMKEEKAHYRSVSGYVLFPDDPTKIGNVEEYHFYDYKSEGGIELFLEISFSQDEFTKEISRLENISFDLFYYIEGEAPTRYIKKDMGVLFNQTTYVTMYNRRGRYEYAAIDEENMKISYVCVECMSEEMISFDKGLLPKSYYSWTDLSKENTDAYVYEIYSNSDMLWYD